MADACLTGVAVGIEALAILIVAASFVDGPDFPAERVPFVRGSSVC